MSVDESPNCEQRQIFWSELDSDGKIERMRQEVHRLQDRVREQNRTIRSLLKHQHADSKILIPLMDGGFPGGGPYIQNRPKDDDVYF